VELATYIRFRQRPERDDDTPSLRERGDCHEDGLLHSLGRLIEKIRPKEKAEEKKRWKKAVSRCRLLFK
jgi:hypothetical protein